MLVAGIEKDRDLVIFKGIDAMKGKVGSPVKIAQLVVAGPAVQKDCPASRRGQASDTFQKVQAQALTLNSRFEHERVQKPERSWQ